MFSSTRITDIISMPSLEKLLATLHAIFGVPIILTEVDGTVLIDCGCNQPCQRFFHNSPEKTVCCLNSTGVADGGQGGTDTPSYTLTTCRHGLHYVVMPLTIGDKLLGHVLAGGFLPCWQASHEMDFPQAVIDQYAFDRKAFFDALDQLPVIDQERAALLMKHMGSIMECIHETRKINSCRQVLYRTGDHQQFLEDLVNAIPAPLLFMDKEAKLQLFNELFRVSILGLAKEDLFDRPLHELTYHVPPDLVRFLSQHALAKADEKEPQTFETELLCPDGLRRTFLAHKSFFRDQSGVVLGVIGIMTDISKQKNTEVMLSEKEQRLSEIINGNSIATFVIDRTHTITHWNGACEQLFNISAESMIGSRNQWQPFYSHPRETMADMIVSNASTKEALSVHYPGWKPYKSVKGAYAAEAFFKKVGQNGQWLFFTAAPIRDSSGNIVGAIETVQDTTSRKKAEEKLTRALEQVKNAYNSKNEFLENMAHEIRTPLNVIAGMAYSLQQTTRNNPQHRYLNVMESAIEHLVHLVENVFDFTRLESRKLEPAYEPFKLSAAIRQPLEMFTYQAEENGLTLNFRIDADVPDNLIGDYSKIRQILINLVDYAVKYAESGMIEVHVCIDPESSTSPPETNVNDQTSQINLLFCVHDQETGMPPSSQKEDFHFFPDNERSTVKKTRRKCIGLSIASELVSGMGGRIWAESYRGNYSRFCFTVPLTLNHAPELFLRDQDLKTTSLTTVSPLHILSVDDLVINHEILTPMLISFGHSVQKVYNGMEALEALEKDHYDLILMDIKMPIMDGYQAVRRIRAHRNPQIAGIPIFAVTAHVMKGEENHFLQAGMNGHISKPIQIRNLHQEIEAVARTRKYKPDGQENTAAGLINLEFALSLLDNEVEVLKISCNAILREIPKLLHQLKSGLTHQDEALVNRMAHSIKSSAKSIGSDDIAALAQKVEDAASVGSLEEAENLWPVFQEKVERMLDELRLEFQKMYNQ